jgi:hypothetical protein
MRQNTTPFVKLVAGGEVVYTTGSYPYVRRKASSQPEVWNTEDRGCLSTNSVQRRSPKGLKL